MSLADGQHYVSFKAFMQRHLSPLDRRRYLQATAAGLHNHRVSLNRQKALHTQRATETLRRLKLEDEGVEAQP